MDTVPLLAALFFLPGADTFAPMDVGFDMVGLVMEDARGKGAELTDGGRITFDYVITGEEGKTFGSTDRRGLSYTTELTPDGADAFFVGALRGMQAGGVRRIVTLGQSLGVVGDGLVPRDETVTVQVLARQIRTPKSRQVE